MYIKKTPEEYFEIGDNYLSQGQYRKAIQEFDKAVEIDPNYHSAWNGVGVAYHNLGECELPPYQ